MEVPLDTLPNLLIHYEMVKRIDKGGNSTIWSIQNSRGDLYACKIPDRDAESLIISEAETMSQISKFPNYSPFLTFYGLYEYNNLPVIVEELFLGQSLNVFRRKVLKRQVPLDVTGMLSIAKSIFEQLGVLHLLGFDHGDLHAGNILYNPRTKRFVLIDIGPQFYDPDEDPEIIAEVTGTTPQYWLEAISTTSPRILFQKKDIYDAGEILYSLMGYDTWEDFITTADMNKYSSQMQKLYTLIEITTNENILERPSAEEILAYIQS